MARMTRKDFIKRAAELNMLRGAFATYSEFKTYCEQQASELARTNPRFDRSRFLAACGIE